MNEMILKMNDSPMATEYYCQGVAWRLDSILKINDSRLATEYDSQGVARRLDFILKINDSRLATEYYCQGVAWRLDSKKSSQTWNENLATDYDFHGVVWLKWNEVAWPLNTIVRKWPGDWTLKVSQS